LFIDVEKKLEKHKEPLDKEMSKSNEKLKKILKYLGDNYKKSVELAESLLSNIVDLWSRIEDTSKDADPISEDPTRTTWPIFSQSKKIVIRGGGGGGNIRGVGKKN
jgi:hypothetical protein